MTLSDFKIFAELSDALFNNAEAVYTKGINFIDALSPICSLAFGVYILLQVWHYYNKGFDEPLMDLTKRLIGWIIVIALAFNAHNIEQIGKAGWALPDELASVVHGEKYDGNVIDDQFKAMAEEIIKLEDLRNEEYSGLTEVSSSVLAAGLIGCIFLMALILCAVTFAFYVLAKMLLLLTLTFAPLFLASFLFPSTRQWGMSWVNAIIMYSLTIVGYVIVGVMQQKFVSGVITKYTAGMEGGELMVSLFLLFAIVTSSTVIFVFTMWNVPSLMSSLVGGASFSSHARELSPLKNIKFERKAKESKENSGKNSENNSIKPA